MHLIFPSLRPLTHNAPPPPIQQRVNLKVIVTLLFYHIPSTSVSVCNRLSNRSPYPDSRSPGTIVTLDGAQGLLRVVHFVRVFLFSGCAINKTQRVIRFWRTYWQDGNAPGSLLKLTRSNLQQRTLHPLLQTHSETLWLKQILEKYKSFVILRTEN